MMIVITILIMFERRILHPFLSELFSAVKIPVVNIHRESFALDSLAPNHLAGWLEIRNTTPSHMAESGKWIFAYAGRAINFHFKMSDCTLESRKRYTGAFYGVANYRALVGCLQVKCCMRKKLGLVEQRT